MANPAVGRACVVLISLVAVVTVAVVGAFWINGALLNALEGRSFDDGYTLLAISSIAYGCWFAVVGWGGARLTRPTPAWFLGVTAVGIFACLVLSSSVWVNPVATRQEWMIFYARAFAASFMVFPAFGLVWFFQGGDASNH
jgi:hypothetical protein